MKHNWEYQELGKILKTTSGGTPLKGVSDYYNYGTIPWLRSGEVCKKDIYECDIYITEKAVEESNAKFIPVNSVVIAMYGATAGQVGIIRKEMTTNQAICSIFPSSYYLQDFLYYYLYSQKDNIIKKAYGAAQSNISQTIIKELNIPIPPKEVQEQIVVELDKINEIISDCKEAIRNLDSLAQSLFYDYFGNPITNPNGWELKPMQSILRLHSGNALTSANIVEGPYPVYGGNGIVGYHKSSNLSGDNIIIGRVGALCGNVRLVSGNIYVTDNAFISSFVIPMNLTFAVHLLTMLDLRKYAKAAAQPVISNSSLKDILIILPPLSLQEKFAARIEQIEQQKKGLEETIANMQTLLDSRMDYWFG